MSPFLKKKLEQIKYKIIALECGHERRTPITTLPITNFECKECGEFKKLKDEDQIKEMTDLARLEEILKTMEIPEQRTKDLRWLDRNIHVRNHAHPRLNEAMQIVANQLKTLYRLER